MNEIRQEDQFRYLLLKRLVLDEDTWAGHEQFTTDTVFFEQFFNSQIGFHGTEMENMLSGGDLLQEAMLLTESIDPSYVKGAHSPAIQLEGEQMIMYLLKKIELFEESMVHELDVCPFINHPDIVLLLKVEIANLCQRLNYAFIDASLEYCGQLGLRVLHPEDPRLRPNLTLNFPNESTSKFVTADVEQEESVLYAILGDEAHEYIDEIVDTTSSTAALLHSHEPYAPSGYFLRQLYGMYVVDWYTLTIDKGTLSFAMINEGSPNTSRVVVSYQPLGSTVHFTAFIKENTDYVTANHLLRSLFIVVADRFEQDYLLSNDRVAPQIFSSLSEELQRLP